MINVFRDIADHKLLISTMSHYEITELIQNMSEDEAHNRLSKQGMLSLVSAVVPLLRTFLILLLQDLSIIFFVGLSCGLCYANIVLFFWLASLGSMNSVCFVFLFSHQLPTRCLLFSKSN